MKARHTTYDLATMLAVFVSSAALFGCGRDAGGLPEEDGWSIDEVDGEVKERMAKKPLPAQSLAKVEEAAPVQGPPADACMAEGGPQVRLLFIYNVRARGHVLL